MTFSSYLHKLFGVMKHFDESQQKRGWFLFYLMKKENDVLLQVNQTCFCFHQIHIEGN